MKYLLMMKACEIEDMPPMDQWAPEEVQASWGHMGKIHQELTESGELVGAEALAGTETARIVISDGSSAPVVTDGPFAEAKEFLAGYWMVDVDSEARAIEIAARTSAAPGYRGRPTRRRIEVRAIMTGPDPAV